jgi:uncharacterized protein YcnI
MTSPSSTPRRTPSPHRVRRSRPSLRPSRLIATAALALALAIAAPLTASAHVVVTPNQAPAGGYAQLTFRVPTESATAGTVKLEIDFPTATPFTSLSYQPVPGWTAIVTTSTLATPVKTSDATITQAPTKIVWTANPGVEIQPGQFQQFSVSAGVVPDTGEVMMPAIQTYSDGTVVRWDQATPTSGEEPEHPAPTLYINETPPATGSHTPLASEPTLAASPAPTPTDAVALGLGLAGLLLGAIALVVAVLASTRRPSARPSGASVRTDAASDADTKSP